MKFIATLLILSSVCLAGGWDKIDTAVTNGGNAATLQSLDTTNMKSHTLLGTAAGASLLQTLDTTTLKAHTLLGTAANASTLQTIDTTNLKANTITKAVGQENTFTPIQHYTAGVGVGANDSLKITPEGGIAVLMKNITGGFVYAGHFCRADTLEKSISNTDVAGPFVVYSDSIANNAWGYFNISGLVKMYVANNQPHNSTQKYCIGDGTVGDASIATEYCGYLVSRKLPNKTAHGDSVALGIITKFSIPDI